MQEKRPKNAPLVRVVSINVHVRSKYEAPKSALLTEMDGILVMDEDENETKEEHREPFEAYYIHAC